MNKAVENHFAEAASNRHLDWLESESIHIMREVAAECSNPALLFSEVVTTDTKQVSSGLWNRCSQ
jgi:3'-phosphoadenosine 5'-phosphosulfate sulfotransferase (PAPS reductase)/FAD synthetase